MTDSDGNYEVTNFFMFLSVCNKLRPGTW